MWKLHEIGDEGVYKNLRYDRIRFLEEVGGAPHLTPYIDPGSHFADIGVAFQMDANWDEILGVLGFDTTADADYIERIQALVNKKTFTDVTIEQLKTDLKKRGQVCS
jgi:hypothetical protein